MLPAWFIWRGIGSKLCHKCVTHSQKLPPAAKSLNLLRPPATHNLGPPNQWPSEPPKVNQQCPHAISPPPPLLVYSLGSFYCLQAAAAAPKMLQHNSQHVEQFSHEARISSSSCSCSFHFHSHSSCASSFPKTCAEPPTGFSFNAHRQLN